MAGTTPQGRAELIVVAGGTTTAGADGVERVIQAICLEGPGTVVVHHDLRDVERGLVHRRLRSLHRVDATTTLALAHGCVSCTLREDVLPLLRTLGARDEIHRIVLHLDPVLEPDQVCWAVLHVLVDGAMVTDAVDLRGVISVLDIGTWLADATSEQDVADRDLAALPDDERTIAQLVVNQAEFADLIVYAGTAEPWQLARTSAVLARLTPLAPRLPAAELNRRVLLESLPRTARRGRPEESHGALLRGQPPLDPVAGIQLVTFIARRPFHPGRLHDAVDVLLDGVVRTRGRIWLATRPDAVLWLESAGGGLQVGYVGDWLAEGDAAAWDRADAERQAKAALLWHPRWGDRAQELAILVDGADPEIIDGGLRDALLTDRELAEGEQAWRRFADPFGWWHTDPCDDVAPQPAHGRNHKEDRA